MFKVKAITAVIVTGIFGLAACGGGSGDKDDSPVTTVRQKNAALLPNLKMPQTTAPKTAASVMAPTTTFVLATTTSIVKTVATTLPKLPNKNLPTTTTVPTTMPNLKK
jgi:hypothetical protein